MRGFVGVTDLTWYLKLSGTSLVHDEVNFWFPSARMGFAALDVGEPFIFKTHHTASAPSISNRLVGVGLYSGFARLRVSEAWKHFATSNGTSSLYELRAQIGRYRREPLGPAEDPEIGCVLLNTVKFLDPGQTLPAPIDFAANIVRGKTYDLESLTSSHSVLESVLQHFFLDLAPSFGELGAETRGLPALQHTRIGQAAFKAVVGEKYRHRCAVTGDKVRPVLQAAHILPVAQGGEHRVDNGLYLRSDVHTLFDEGYISVDTQHRLRVSSSLREQFGNGEWFYARAGDQIELPSDKADRPSREFLEWHNDEVFKVAT